MKNTYKLFQNVDLADGEKGVIINYVFIYHFDMFVYRVQLEDEKIYTYRENEILRGYYGEKV